tara:strand:- start:41 stop:1084 length:1044 start_codon:yes stop_codon:yes gene_type:complete
MAYTTINKSSEHFTNKVYTGTGSARNITGLGFQPDFSIVKRKDSTGVWYNTDIVRGAGKQMYLNETGGMGGSASTTEITGFNSDGFNLGTDGGVNASGGTYTSFNFLANNTTGSSNTDGTITSTVSANTTAGFSIIKYTGTGANASFGHGLGGTPAVYILKRLTGGASTWLMYHKSLGIGYHVGVNNSAAKAANDASFANNTAPDASKIYLGNWGDLNANGSDFICYAWKEIQGYSKFGSYTGNGNADGSFIYTGFKPRFIHMRNVDTASSPVWIDMSNTSFTNVHTGRLYTDGSSAIDSTVVMDGLSNGFKLRTAIGNCNSIAPFIYMAFAEAPLVGTNNVPATAR